MLSLNVINNVSQSRDEITTHLNHQLSFSPVFNKGHILVNDQFYDFEVDNDGHVYSPQQLEGYDFYAGKSYLGHYDNMNFSPGDITYPNLTFKQINKYNDYQTIVPNTINTTMTYLFNKFPWTNVQEHSEKQDILKEQFNHLFKIKEIDFNLTKLNKKLLGLNKDLLEVKELAVITCQVRTYQKKTKKDKLCNKYMFKNKLYDIKDKPRLVKMYKNRIKYVNNTIKYLNNKKIKAESKLKNLDGLLQEDNGLKEGINHSNEIKKILGGDYKIGNQKVNKVFIGKYTVLKTFERINIFNENKKRGEIASKYKYGPQVLETGELEDGTGYILSERLNTLNFNNKRELDIWMKTNPTALKQLEDGLKKMHKYGKHTHGDIHSGNILYRNTINGNEYVWHDFDLGADIDQRRSSRAKKKMLDMELQNLIIGELRLQKVVT